MTYTKRQWFIYRLGQCLNLLNKICLYYVDVNNFVKYSKFESKFLKIHNKLIKYYLQLNKLREKVIK